MKNEDYFVVDSEEDQGSWEDMEAIDFWDSILDKDDISPEDLDEDYFYQESLEEYLINQEEEKELISKSMNRF